MAHTIAIIGAGPRGTYTFRRLALYLSRAPLNQAVEIHVIERSGNFGGGGVHSPSQPDYLLLNTIAAQITAFGDDDTEARESPARRSLHGFLVSQGLDIGPNDYPSRAQHGQYLKAAFDWTESRLPQGVTLHRHALAVTDLDPASMEIFLADGRILQADEILLVTGHFKTRIVPDSPAQAWAQFARKQQQQGRNISYVHFAYPIAEQTAHIRPGESVYVIGMGLTAIDVIRAMTRGRGGRFSRDEYFPGGKEPDVIIGSRLGLPYWARAFNQKQHQYQPRILTFEAVRAIQQQKDRLDFQADLFPLLLQEMEYVYYSVLKGEAFGAQYLACADAAQRRALIEKHCDRSERFDWKRLEDPLAEIAAAREPGHPLFDSLESYHQFVLQSLADDIREAEKGNMDSPLKNAVDSVLRDCRDVLRSAVNFGGLTPASHRYLNTEFNRVNNRTAVGPPVGSTRELYILAKKGLVGFSGPSPVLSADEASGEFILESPEVAGSRRRVQHVVNGRIHKVDAVHATSKLLRRLFERGAIRTYVNTDGDSEYPLGGLDVSENFHLIDAGGRPHPHLCALGIPAEGKFWFNAADARPDVNSTAITQVADWAQNAVERLRQK